MSPVASLLPLLIALGEPSSPSADDEEIARALAADAAAATPAVPPSAPVPTGAAPTSGSVFNPDIALILDVAGAWFSSREPLQLGEHDPAKSGFNLQQLELSLGKSVDPYFRLDSFIVFHPDGVELEEGYATTLALPASLQLRAGLFLTRFGRINPTHPHAWDFVDQPLMLGKLFGGEGNRGLGFELSWLAPLPWYAELVWSATDAAGEGTNRSFYGATDLGVHGALDVEHLVALKQFFALSDDWSLLWGVTGVSGPQSLIPNKRTEIFATDLYLKWRPITTGSYTTVSLTAESYVRRRHASGDHLDDAGGYAALLWRFARRWASGVRYEHGTAARDRAGDVVVDPLDPEWTGGRHRAAANVTFYPSEFSRVRLQGSVDAPSWRDRPIAAMFLAGEFLIGAHGAHPF